MRSEYLDDVSYQSGYEDGLAVGRAEALDVRDPKFVAAVDAVFAAPGEFGPAKGYYGTDTGHFIDMLEAFLR